MAPVHRLLQRGVRRLLYGDAADPYEALRRLGATLETAAAPAEALERLAGEVARLLHVPAVWVLVLDGPKSRHGEDLGVDPVRVRLAHAGEVVGELALTRPRAGEFRPAEARLLEVLARQAGAAAHAARLAADLDRSRRALVTARAEERRRLRRDLHDHLGPSLSAVNLQLGVLRALTTTDPARHARAGGCDIEVELAPDALHLSIRDDGVGMTGSGPRWRVGVGLESMAEAAAQLDGKCEILAPAGGGTEIRVRLPRVEV